MKITSASITGLFDSFDHKITINPKGITFVHSTNGVGKSVFLKLIYSTLKADIETLKAIPFERIDIGFDDESNLIIEKGDDLLIQMQKNELEEKFDLDELQEVMDSNYISPERLTVKKKDGRLMYAIDVYCEELEDRFLTAKEESAIDINGAIVKENMADDEIETILMTLKSKTDFMTNSGLRINLPIGLRLTPSRYDINKSHENYLKLTYVLANYVKDNYELAESIVVFQDIVNSFFINKKLRITNGRMSITMSNGQTIPLESLSSGEKHILIIFYRLLFQTDPGSLVIIDEPEISLHISWQQKMGIVLTDVCKLRDLQIVAATHSPQIIHDMWDLANELRPERA